MKNKEKSVRHMMMVPIQILRIGTIRERITRFYEMRGYTALGGIEIRTPDEVAEIIGLDGDTRARTVVDARNKLTRQGVLVKVEQDVWNTKAQRTETIYSWDRNWGSTVIDASGLEVLNSPVEKFGVVYENQKDVWKHRLSVLPDIKVHPWQGRLSWYKVLPQLLDLEDPDTVAFWQYKLANACKSHKALKSYDTIEEKMMAALYGFESGCTRNFDHNPSWKVNGIGYILDSIKNRVGVEYGWRLPSDVDFAVLTGDRENNQWTLKKAIIEGVRRRSPGRDKPNPGRIQVKSHTPQSKALPDGVVPFNQTSKEVCDA